MAPLVELSAQCCRELRRGRAEAHPYKGPYKESAR
jgi:hypothetical protein